MSLAAYPKYKDSGVAWLGEVPAHWGVRKFRWLFEIKKRISGELGYDILSITQQGIKVKDIESNDGQISMDYSKYQIVEVGDFAMNHMDLLTGYVDISAQVGVTSPDYRVFTIRDAQVCYDKYALYLFQMGYRNKIFYAFGQGSSQLGRWRLPTEQFNDFCSPLPPIEEQIAIAAFLDRETSKIDSLVVEQETLIALLKEKRQALISHAVTKGLNPNAPMKDSGIAWLGEAPAHWKSARLRWLATKYAGGTPDKQNQSFWTDGEIPWINSGSVNDSIITKPSAYITQEAFENSSAKWIPSGALVMALAGQGKTKGMVAQLGLKTTCNQSMAAILPNKNTQARFLYWWLSSNYENIRNLAGGDLRDGLNLELLGNIQCPVLPVDEQITIATFLDTETAKLDTLTAEANQAITLLKERRSALISAAVTGQIDVRHLDDSQAIRDYAL